MVATRGMLHDKTMILFIDPYTPGINPSIKKIMITGYFSKRFLELYRLMDLISSSLISRSW